MKCISGVCSSAKFAFHKLTKEKAGSIIMDHYFKARELSKIILAPRLKLTFNYISTSSRTVTGVFP